MQPLRATPQGVVRSEVQKTGADFKRNRLYLRVGFLIQKKLQISSPEIKKGLYVCSRLEKSLRRFKAKQKVH